MQRDECLRTPWPGGKKLVQIKWKTKTEKNGEAKEENAPQVRADHPTDGQGDREYGDNSRGRLEATDSEVQPASQIVYLGGEHITLGDKVGII